MEPARQNPPASSTGFPEVVIYLYEREPAHAMNLRQDDPRFQKQRFASQLVSPTPINSEPKPQATFCQEFRLQHTDWTASPKLPIEGYITLYESNPTNLQSKTNDEL